MAKETKFGFIQRHTNNPQDGHWYHRGAVPVFLLSITKLRFLKHGEKEKPERH